MFRSLFGGTASDANHPTSANNGSASNPSHSASRGERQDEEENRGGFFKLDPMEIAPAESLFDDLELKPPAVAPSKPAAGAVSTSAPPMAKPGSGEGVFSAFRFMATPGADESTLAAADDPADRSTGGGMSAFSFLADSLPSVSAGVVDPQPPAVVEAGDAAIPGISSTSSFSFLTSRGVKEESAVAGMGLGTGDRVGATESTIKTVTGASDDGSSGRRDSSISEAGSQNTVQPSTSAAVGSRPGNRSTTPSMAEAAGEKATPIAPIAAGRVGVGTAGNQAESSATPAFGWKPSTGVVRKKRTARRVGYARDDTLAAIDPGTASSPSSTKQGTPATTVSAQYERSRSGSNSSVASGKTGVSTKSSTSAGMETEELAAVVASSSTIRGGISYVHPDGGNSKSSADAALPGTGQMAGLSSFGSALGEREMEDSVMAEAAAMAALAASMAPGTSGAIKGGGLTTAGRSGEHLRRFGSEDLRLESSHGTGTPLSSYPHSSSPKSTSSSGKQSGTKTSNSFMSKVKGLLGPSSSKSDAGPPTPADSAYPRGTEEASADEAYGADGRAGAYIQPAFFAGGDQGKATATESAATAARALETMGAEGRARGEDEEGEPIQAVRAELAVLLNAFRSECSTLTDRLTDAEATRAALKNERAAVKKVHTEASRRLVEIEAEQQRLADEEEYEKAAELSTELSRLQGQSENAARRLRELEDEEASLELAASEGRKELLLAVEDAAVNLRNFQRKQDGRLGRLVSERAAMFEAESRRMNTEAERIALEKTHVERDSAHLEEELDQTEEAISSQTGGDDERMSRLRLMRMELEGEVKDLEAQLEAKKGALIEVMLGLDEGEARIEAVRGKFDRQLQRLRERERLVAVSREDCQKEEEALARDRERHRAAKEEATRQQQVLLEAVKGVGEEVTVATLLQTTLANHWGAEEARGSVKAEDDAETGAVVALRLEVEMARHRYEQRARAVTGLQNRREALRLERSRNAEALPALEQQKRAAVISKDYKEAGQVSRQIKEMERQQQDVVDMLLEIDNQLAEGSEANVALEAISAELEQAQQALRVSEEAVDVASIKALEQRARELRRARRSVGMQGKATGIRETADALILLQLSSLESEAREIGARHSLPPPNFSKSQPSDADDDPEQQEVETIDDDVLDVKDSKVRREGPGVAEAAEAGQGVDKAKDEAIVDGEDDIATQQHGDSGDPSPDVSSGAGASENSGDDYDPGSIAARQLLEAEMEEAARELEALEAQLAATLEEEDYDAATEVDSQMEQVRARLADFSVAAAAMSCAKSPGRKGRGGGTPTGRAQTSAPPATNEDNPRQAYGVLQDDYHDDFEESVAAVRGAATALADMPPSSTRVSDGESDCGEEAPDGEEPTRAPDGQKPALVAIYEENVVVEQPAEEADGNNPQAAGAGTGAELADVASEDCIDGSGSGEEDLRTKEQGEQGIARAVEALRSQDQGEGADEDNTEDVHAVKSIPGDILRSTTLQDVDGEGGEEGAVIPGHSGQNGGIERPRAERPDTSREAEDTVHYAGTGLMGETEGSVGGEEDPDEAADAGLGKGLEKDDRLRDVSAADVDGDDGDPVATSALSFISGGMNVDGIEVADGADEIDEE